MPSAADKNLYYRALVAKKPEYNGVFYVGVRTTGVFCRPTCPARKPKLENCEFFRSAAAALAASFRPCKRCRPLAPPDDTTDLVRTLVRAVEAEPEKRWGEGDFRALGVDASTVRRGFKRRFGVTFVQYARARRLGQALEQLRAGESVIAAQLASGYRSGSGFREAFSRVLGAAPNRRDRTALKAARLDTPLGPMLAVADEEALHLLEFTDRRGLESELERLRSRTEAAIIPGETGPVRMIGRELEQYFLGKLRAFRTPTAPAGSPFQACVWDALRRVPYGQTRSYTELAADIGQPSAVRAVARANGANTLALVIPCHRVVGADGSLCGYGGGQSRKGWLLEHERER